MDKIVIGILAHVDAGKTTLSESILYNTGIIREMGRVDKKDAFLDTNVMEKERGITIFSKQAIFELQEKFSVTLLDTPGHVDFSPEAERTLWALDYAVLVVSRADGVQGHTRTLFSLLKSYNIPTIIFVNKMDQPGREPFEVLDEIKERLSDSCVDFSCYTRDSIKNETLPDEFYDEISLLDEKLLEEYLESGKIGNEDIKALFNDAKMYPVFFGSALKNTGVNELLDGLCLLAGENNKRAENGGRIFKITRDEAGNRMTHIKVTGGCFRVRDIISDDEGNKEKITQIRLYNGAGYEAVSEAVPGGVYAFTGLNATYGGQGIGFEEDVRAASLEPVMTYSMLLPDDVDPMQMMKKLLELCEDMPELHAKWDEQLKEIKVSIMGQVQLEILTRVIKDRFDTDVAFGTGKIVYKETIANTVEGVGHFEPLRHYAETHLKLEPGERGSGIQAEADVPEDILAENWKRLIVTHILERSHRGVLTGALLTDVKITVVGGRAHAKHTNGGDFRQATYRAVRQGLMQAANVLLEPYFSFSMRVPDECVGRVMTDLGQKNIDFTGPAALGEGYSSFEGKGPVSILNDYPGELTAYTKGKGEITLSFAGYDVCHNPEEVIAKKGYDPLSDIKNTPDSVFCSHGAGTIVPWNEVFEHMHVEPCLSFDENGNLTNHVTYDKEAKMLEAARKVQLSSERANSMSGEIFMGYEEVDSIVAKAGGGNFKAAKREIGVKEGWKREKRTGSVDNASTKVSRVYKGTPALEKYMLVDGYNVIHAFKELSNLCDGNLDGARGKLLDILCNYQAMKKVNLIAVFDAYRVKGSYREVGDYNNIHVVYTKEAETADAYIERFAHEYGKKYDITVVTSDGLEQVIIMGAGCHLTSAREFEKEIAELNRTIREEHIDKLDKTGNKLMDNLSQQGRDIISKMEAK